MMPTDAPVVTKRKLIEVALPLDAINKASAREKSIRHGHPSTLHLWWARRPLAAARAVIFAQMVDDPSANPDLFPTEAAQEKERQRLFGIIEELVKWENTTNEVVLEKAREEIRQSWRRTCAENADHPRADELFNRDKLPAFHDPFAGGGSLPLEAQRLGLEAHASDLNPVAVLINKAMIEIPPKFAGKPPVNPETRGEARLTNKTYRGAEGLAEDVRYYGQWMRDEAERRIGHLYPKVLVTEEMAADRPDLEPYVGRELTVIAWIWARTVKSPNPAFTDVDVPLVSTFVLSKKKGKEAWVEPVLEGGGYRFEVRLGVPPASATEGTKLGRGANFKCVMSGSVLSDPYVKAESSVGRMGARLMAVIADGNPGRICLSPVEGHEAVAQELTPSWRPELRMSDNPRWFSPPAFGMKTFGDIFTERQLVALTTYCDLVADAKERVRRDAANGGLPDEGGPIRSGGLGADAYAEAVSVYLSLALSRLTDISNALCPWEPTKTQTRNLFRRQAIAMLWDYSENNVFAGAAGDYMVSLDSMRKALVNLPSLGAGSALQDDAQLQTISNNKLISTDPPYYDNIGYSDLSDYFYVWLRALLGHTYSELFSTVAVPKREELVATAQRHGSRESAEEFFLQGMTKAIERLSSQACQSVPVTIYYAFKQSEKTTLIDGVPVSTGWETFLGAAMEAGFSIYGTWPIRTELVTGLKRNINALASSIVLVCRPRSASSPSATRREFLDQLRLEFPRALVHLQRSNIAPVDLAQASIGPGMRIFTEYREVLNADGSAMTVREALALINATLDEVLAEQEGDFDADSRWALTWFEQHGFDEGEFGDAEQLSKAKNTSPEGLVQAGVIESRRRKVRLYRPSELAEDWDAASDSRLTVWEMTHHLIRLLEAGGEEGAAELAAGLGAQAEIARDLAYRLYVVSDRKKRAEDARQYNALVQSWSEIMRLAQLPSETARQAGLEFAEE